MRIVFLSICWLGIVIGAVCALAGCENHGNAPRQARIIEAPHLCSECGRMVDGLIEINGVRFRKSKDLGEPGDLVMVTPQSLGHPVGNTWTFRSDQHAIQDAIEKNSVLAKLLAERELGRMVSAQDDEELRDALTYAFLAGRESVAEDAAPDEGALELPTVRGPGR